MLSELRGLQIITVNLGSTSTEVGYLLADGSSSKQKIQHSESNLQRAINDQLDFRLADVKRFLSDRIDIAKTDIISCRGGRLRPVRSGVYVANESLIADSKVDFTGSHASRLSLLLGVELAKLAENCPVVIVNPVSVDEFSEVARFSGLNGLVRKSLGHFLNSKYIANLFCSANSLAYNETNLIVVHLGGGTTVSAHQNGEVVDLINDFEGGFTPERSGGLPNIELLDLLEKYGPQRVKRFIEGEGGIYSYLQTKDFGKLENDSAQDETARLIIEAFCYQHSKSIASMLSVLNFDVAAILVTGGVAHSAYVQNYFNSKFRDFTLKYYPGSFEFEALADAAFSALKGDIPVLSYPSGEIVKEWANE